MSGNTIGRLFTVTTFGESHGPALGAVVDGCPPGLPISEEELMLDVERRRSGTSHHTSQRKEPDTVRILSGVFEGRTTGTPIGLLVENTDQRSRDYEKIKDRFRPGHADYTYQQKYGFRDYRGGGRSSARETVMRVAAGAIARKYLATRLGVQIFGYLTEIGPHTLKPVDPPSAYDNPFFCPDPAFVAQLEDYLWQIRAAGESVGARLTVVARGVPPGLGEPVFDRLDADIAHAMMGINAVKGIGRDTKRLALHVAQRLECEFEHQQHNGQRNDCHREQYPERLLRDGPQLLVGMPRMALHFHKRGLAPAIHHISGHARAGQRKAPRFRTACICAPIRWPPPRRHRA